MLECAREGWGEGYQTTAGAARRRLCWTLQWIKPVHSGNTYESGATEVSEGLPYPGMYWSGATSVAAQLIFLHDYSNKLGIIPNLETKM